MKMNNKAETLWLLLSMAEQKKKQKMKDNKKEK